MVIPPVTCRIAALGLRGFFLPKAVLYYWKCQSFFSFWFLIRAGLLSKEKIYILVNSLALIATISLPISTALDQNASTKRTKASISFMPLLSFFFYCYFLPLKLQNAAVPIPRAESGCAAFRERGATRCRERSAGTAVRECRSRCRAMRWPRSSWGTQHWVGAERSRASAFHS